MSEPDAIDTTSTLQGQTSPPPDAGLAIGAVALDLGGAQVGAGTLSMAAESLTAGHLGAAPSTVSSVGQPSVGQPSVAPNGEAAVPTGGTYPPAGAAPDGAAATAGIPGATEDVDVMPEVIANINAIEQLALFWGGETGTKIRNHVGRVRTLLAA